MNRGRFSALAGAYGGDLQRWPPEERGAAEAWLISAPEAAAILEQAHRLDQALSGYALPPPPSDLQRRIVTTMLAQRRESRSLSKWLPALGAIGTLAAGAMAGAVAIAVLPVAPLLQTGSEALGSVYEQSSFGDLTDGGRLDG
jgi:ferric-dicitrate binding protein FerR (iron transport regulator)